MKNLWSSLYEIVALAIPISSSRLLNTLTSFAAMMMLASLGKEQLAAGSLALSSYVAILTITTSIFYAIGIRIRYQDLNTPHEEIGKLIKNGIYLAILLAVPAAFSLYFMDKLLLAFGQDPQLVSLTHDYFCFVALGMFPILIVTVIVQFYLGTGKPYLAFIVELINFPLTIIASYGFVLGNFGLPKLGLGGVGLAMLCAHAIKLGIVLMIVCLQKHLRSYQLFKDPFHIDWKICRDILLFGLPIGIQFGGELMAMAVATYLMGYFGVDALAALQIASQYSLVIIMLSFGISQALALKISEALGKKNIAQARHYVQASLILLLMYILPVFLLFYTSATQCAEFYMGNPIISDDFKYLVQFFFAISAVFLLLDSIRNFFSAALRGFHEVKISTRINLSALWLISLPVSWLFAFVLHGGPVALRIGFLSGFIVAVVLLAQQLGKKLSPHLILETTNASL